jgi:hypothetical protein
MLKKNVFDRPVFGWIALGALAYMTWWVAAFHAQPVQAQPASLGVHTIADITGDGAVHQLASSGTARYIQFAALSTNTGTARVGNSSISNSQGIPIGPGVPDFWPPVTAATGYNQSTQMIALSSVYYLVQSGDKISITYWY